MEAPFRFGKIVEGREFTDREEETAWLEEQWKAGNNTMIISPRRWGKSSLVNHAAMKLRKKENIIFCFIDLYNVRSEQEFYELYARELLRATSGNLEEVARTLRTFFTHLLPKITVSPDPGSELSIGFDWKELKKDPSDVLNLAETIARSKKKKIVMCMDEFQNISFFDAPLAFQKRLRAHWQKHRQVAYCLYGSRRHLLVEFFAKPSMPFYQFGEILFLQKINGDHWTEYVRSRFRETGKTITHDQAALIAGLMADHPYFVQQLAQAVWMRTSKKCTEDLIHTTVDILLDQYTILYQKEVDQLTNPQLNFLRAVTEGVERYSAASTLAEYRLGSSANISRIKTALENKEIIEISGQTVTISDPLFEAWLKKRYFR